MHRVLVLLFLFRVVAAGRAAERAPGTSQFGTAGYVESISGDLPIVLTSPHGGTLRPTTLPDRTDGVTDAT